MGTLTLFLKLINYSCSSYPTRAAYSGQVEEFRNPMRKKLKTRPLKKPLFENRMAFCMCMRCWCGGNVQGVCPSFILALLISVFFAIFHMEAPENTQEFFSIAFL